MKAFILSCCILFIFSCKNDINKNKKPSFLIGSWIRVNDKINNQTFENWNADFTGNGYTKQGDKTVFEEKMSIVTLQDTLYLKVEGVNENATLFKFTHQTDTSFICENAKNEFPKKIKYFLENSQLKAIISADNYKIDFIFNKVNP